MKKQKPGEAPPNRVPIFDGRGNMRGHVGKTATSATVARFIGQHGAKLGKKNGRTAWIGPAATPRPQPRRGESANHKSARGPAPAR